MKGVLRLALADLRRRKLQGLVVGAVVMLSSLAGTLAASLLIESDAPFDTAFNAAAGAHLTYRYDMNKATAEQVAATLSLPAVETAGGPWAETPGLTVTIPGGGRLPLALQGRADSGGSVDRLQLVAGRWVQAGGEVVLAQRLSKAMGKLVGDTLDITPGQGIEALQVVGIAAGVNDSSDGWITPAEVARFALSEGSNPGKPTTPPRAAAVFYRLHHAATRAEIDAATLEIGRVVPAGAVLSSGNWLDQKRNADLTTSVMIPFLLAFSVFALVSAAIIIGNVVSGAVAAGYREIGIMKSVGFTPGQVSATLALEMLVPATIGAVAGIAGGVLASQPFLAQTAAAFDLPQSVALIPPVLVLCFACVMTVVLAATLLPAVRAGRLSAIDAMTAGSSPRLGRGRRVARFFAGIPLARALTLGLGDSVARPVRASMTGIAVAIGVCTMTFAIGLTTSLDLVKHALTHDQTVQVQVSQGGFRDSPAAHSEASMEALINDQPGTARYAASALAVVHVDGLGDKVRLVGYRGDATWIGFQVLSGRWFRGPGEAVAPQALLDATHKRVGDELGVSNAGRESRLRIVGVYFESNGDNLLINADWATLTDIAPQHSPAFFAIQLAPGTDSREYSNALVRASNDPSLDVRTAAGRGIDTSFLLIQGALNGVALVLTLIALAGVFNTVVLNTREKARDTAILRALGMTPGQVIAMVLVTVTVIALAGAAAGIPSGEALHREILRLMGEIAAATAVPSPFFAVYPAALVAILMAAGCLIGLLAAWLPATWAARSRVSPLLATE